MASYKTNEISRSLLRKGFRLEPKKDHKYYRLFYKGKKSHIYTKTSHGNKTVDSDELIKKMRTQLHLDKKNFDLLIKCPLTEQAYIDILINNNDLKI